MKDEDVNIDLKVEKAEKKLTEIEKDGGITRNKDVAKKAHDALTTIVHYSIVCHGRSKDFHIEELIKERMEKTMSLYRKLFEIDSMYKFNVDYECSGEENKKDAEHHEHIYNHLFSLMKRITVNYDPDRKDLIQVDAIETFYKDALSFIKQMECEFVKRNPKEDSSGKVYDPYKHVKRLLESMNESMEELKNMCKNYEKK
ncbi:hypothetical protein JXA85_01240 [Candidatus Woesearchaeota archaeon]|nr:hypothetical protein [Candidatus Woesearchaeota archaeon]